MPLPKKQMTAQDYLSLPDGERAELIDGELWDLAAPSRAHQRIQHLVAHQLESFIEQHQGDCQVYPAPFAVNLFADESTFVEPDISVICNPEKLSDRGCEGAPDLVIEVVSPNSRCMDYRTKQTLYADAGVREYWIIDRSMARTTVTRFEQDPAPLVYPFKAPVPVGILPGLMIDIGAIDASL